MTYGSWSISQNVVPGCVILVDIGATRVARERKLPVTITAYVPPNTTACQYIVGSVRQLPCS